jgi:lipopolysaccharide/colanic/teichoic acid biosynthesis glycosyltransferase
MEHIAMLRADSGLLSGGTPTTRNQVDRVHDSSRPDEEHAGRQPRSGQAGQDLPRVFALASTGSERVLAHATFADEFSALLLADPTPHLLAVKRTVDIVLSAAALIALLPLFAVLGALIKVSSSGPVFFAQRRVGHQGRIFKMFKFRSMVVNAEELKPRLVAQNESNGPVFKMRRDPRITAIGKFIRKYSLDELPQLINVLLGDMSLVGPRPPVPSEVVRYESWQHRRFAVRPGLTCLWQVSPDRYRISFDEWMRLDLSYIDHWTLRLDFELILGTFGVVLRGTGE